MDDACIAYQLFLEVHPALLIARDYVSDISACNTYACVCANASLVLAVLCNQVGNKLACLEKSAGYYTAGDLCVLLTEGRNCQMCNTGLEVTYCLFAQCLHCMSHHQPSYNHCILSMVHLLLLVVVCQYGKLL